MERRKRRESAPAVRPVFERRILSRATSALAAAQDVVLVGASEALVSEGAVRVMDALANVDQLDAHLATITDPADAAQLARDFAALARAKGRNANEHLLAYAKAARRCGQLLLPENLKRGHGNRFRRSLDGTAYERALADCQIDQNTGDRWQKLGKVEALKFETWVAAVEAGEKDAALKGFLTESGFTGYSTETPEWYTPSEIIDRTVALLGEIDLDPCSNEGNPNVPAARHFTAADDGLGQVWSGRVYMNPPYGDVIGDWVRKLRDEHIAGNVPEAIALVPARTDTAWWQDNLADTSICYVRGRLRFSDSDNSAPFPSAVVYFGRHLHEFGSRLPDFVENFGDMGEVRITVGQHS